MRLLDYNIAAPEGAVSVSGGYSIQGYKGGGKGGGGGSTRTPTEDQDNLHSIAYASVIDLVSAGPIHGFVDQSNPLRSVYLDSTPIQNEDGSLNFQDVQLEFRAGTQDQRYIPGFPAVESSSAVNVELRSDQPFTRAIQNVHISGVRVGLSVRGLKQQSTETGDITGYRVEYVIELSTDGSAFAEVLRGAFDGKTTQQYSRSHRIDLPRANTGWSVRVRRITPNSSNSTISDVAYVDSITEVTDAKLRRPMSACVGIRVNAKQFQSIPTRAYHLYLRVVRVPSNYDAWTRSYAGTWDGTFKMSWTDNPAWVFYDLATNACDGLGRLLPAGWVDRWALYQIARYCDELVPDGKGGTEPRFSCNVYLQDKAEAWKVLQDLASVFRGLAYYAHGSVLAVADMPRDAVYTYSNANVVDGKFNYAGSGLKTRYTVALVSWNDETDMGRAKVEVVEDSEGIARYGVRQVELTAFGCTSQGQAQRLGRSALFTSRMETESVTFAVGLSGTLAQPGQVIEVADAHLAGRRIGGLIQSATVRAVTLDAPARVSAGDRLTVVLPSGVSQTRVVAASVGQGAELQVIPVATPFSQAPQTEAAWSISAPDLATQKYRVLTVSEGPGLQHTITALQYVDGKHAAIDYQTRVETPPISVVPPPVQNLPTNVVITSYHVLAQGQARHNAVISWDAAANAVAYEVQWRRDNSEWVSMPRTGSTSVEVPNIYAGGYVARVRAINVLGVSSLWATSVLTQLNGEVSTPQPVTHLVTASIPWGIRLSWGFPAGPNIIERTEIRYSATQSFADARPAGGFAYPTDSFEQTGLSINTEHHFWARLVDKNGTLGPWFPAESAPGIRGTPSQVASEYNDLITEEIVAGGLGELIMGDIHDIPSIRDAVGEINIDLGELNGRVDEINGQVQELLNAGEWDVGAAYAVGTVVFADGKMYRAKTAVPAGTPITSTDHWELIGDYASITDGLAVLAVQAQETITRVENAEGRIQANAEQINMVAGQVNDPATGLGALGSAVQSMRTQVGQLETGLQSLSEATTALSSRVDGIDWAQDAIADAVNSLTTRVTITEGRIDSQASSITQLTGRVDGLVAPAGKLLKNSNVERVRAPEAYAMGGYDAIRPLDNVKTYTLVSCITHQPAEGETASSVGAWAGNGSQAISTSVAKNAVREVSVRKFVRSGQNLSSTLISFYYFPSSVKTGNATVHWACLYEGDVVPPMEWQPSIEELNAGLAASVEAVGGLTTRVEAAEGGLTTQGQSITKIDARLASGQDSDSLLPDYLMANPDCWFSHYGTNLAPRFVMTETGKIAPTVFRHTIGNSFNYSKEALPIEGRYRVRFWSRRSANSDGKTYVTVKLVRPDGTSLSSDYTSVELTGRVPADEQWYLVDHVYEANAANKANYARAHYGFAANHTGAQGWAEVQGFRVTRVTGSGDINPNEVATAQSVSSLSGTVTQQGNTITSQGQAVTALQNTVNDPNTGVAATAGALNDTKTRVTDIEGKQQAQSENQLVLSAEVRRLQFSEEAELEQAMNQVQTQAALSEFKRVQADDTRALAESITTLQASIGQDSAAVEQIMRSMVEMEDDFARIYAGWGIKLQANSNGVRYVAGVGLDLTNESGVMQSTFAVLADRFAVMHAVNGNPVTVFSVQNGASILNTALIGYASIGQAHIADAAISRAKIQDAAIGAAQIENASITNAKILDAAITRAKIGIAEVDTLRIAGNSVTLHAARNGAGDINIYAPYGGVATVLAWYGGYITDNAGQTPIRVETLLNGVLAGEQASWSGVIDPAALRIRIQYPIQSQVSIQLQPGNNVITVRARMGSNQQDLATNTVVFFAMR